MEDHEMISTLEAGLSKTVRLLGEGWSGAINPDGTPYSREQKIECGEMALDQMAFTKALRLVLNNSL